MYVQVNNEALFYQFAVSSTHSLGKAQFYSVENAETNPTSTSTSSTTTAWSIISKASTSSTEGTMILNTNVDRLKMCLINSKLTVVQGVEFSS